MASSMGICGHGRAGNSRFASSNGARVSSRETLWGIQPGILPAFRRLPGNRHRLDRHACSAEHGGSAANFGEA